MLILRNIIITILLICLTAISIVGLMVEFPPIVNWTPDRINQLGHSVVDIMRPGLMLFLFWWLVLLGCLLVFFITVARPRRRMKIEVQMGGGRVVIMDAAIKKYIRSALAELSGVHVKKIDLREQRGQVTTDIYADVKTRQNLPTLERMIISRVRTALAEDLGITNLGDVHVYIKNFEVTGRPIKPAPAPADQPAAAEDPATRSSESLPDETLTTPGTATGADAPEPVIGGEEPVEAEHAADSIEAAAAHGGEVPVEFPVDEAAAEAPDVQDAPAVTEVSGEDDVIIAEKPLPPQESDEDRGDHPDLDEPLPWDIVRPRDDDEDKKPDDNGGSRTV